MFHRKMAFGGGWYPADREGCEREIESFRFSNLVNGCRGGCLGVVPHAGWIYSGRLAWGVFSNLMEPSGVDLVVVLGGHLGPGDPMVAMTEGEWDTPFGPFAIHTGFKEALTGFEGVVLETEKRFSPDNSVELQLPLAKYKYPDAELLPIRVPPGPEALRLGRELAGYLEAGSIRFVVVASTDLTHYGPQYGFEPQGRGPAALNWVKGENDPVFIRAVESGDGRSILASARVHHNACSPGPVAALNEIAQARGASFHTLEYTTSAEVAGEDAANFVGYLAGVYL
ncbi:MAG: AmmeMemoRadiSam system protein B [Deltaproteobacteria bacterium]|nr:AmmeMemoRadiSam system protein B [Deltaproteobacteria bacterium]